MPRGRTLYTPIRYSFNIEEAAAEFFKHQEARNLSPHTQKTYYYIIKDYVLNFRELNPRTIDTYIILKQKQGLQLTTINTNLKHLRTFINFCGKRGYCAAFKIDFPKVEQTVKEPYTREEMKSLLQRPRSSRWIEWRNWAMINYFYATGQRLSTVLSITVADLDFTNKRVFLRHNKDNIQKYMPLSTALCGILQEYIALSRLQNDDFLFPEYEGKQLSSRGAQDSIAAYNKSRNVSKHSIHLFRHTFAKEYIMNGGNPAKLQRLLNHKTIDMTMRYVNLYSTDISDDFDLFNPLDNTNLKSQIKRRRV